MKKKKVFIISFIVIIIALILTITTVAFYEKHNATSINEIITKEKETIEIQEKEEKINLELASDIDLQKEREKYNNNDIVARLEIPDLFNILIAKGSDNEFYLNHDLYKRKDIKGTEYIDYRVNTESKQINIYGHNSRTYNIPFRKLEKYLEKDFFDSHEYLVLQTFNSKRIYRIFSIKEDNGEYEHMKVSKKGEDFIKHIETLKNNSIYTRDVEYDENSNLLVLQTCSYGKKKTYYVISAIEIQNYTY